MLDVALDARMAFHSGIGRYIRGLTRALVRVEPSLSLTLLIPSSSDGSPWHGLDVRRVHYDVPLYTFREQIAGTWFSRRRARRGQLLHFPHYNSPWGLPPRSVVTIHDLTHLELPQNFPANRVRLAGLALSRAVRRAGALIVVSEATRESLLRRHPDCRDKLHVIHHGVEGPFRPVEPARVEAFRAREGLGRFLLWVGSGRRHKNLGWLLELFEAWRRDDTELVLVADETVGAAGLPRGVRLLRAVDDETLALLYNAAELLCLPSLAEGFGLPALEAMACGTPVVCSDIPALREVVGDGGSCVPLERRDEWIAAIESLMRDDRARRELGGRGLSRARSFSWDEAASRTLEVYRSVAEGRS